MTKQKSPAIPPRRANVTELAFADFSETIRRRVEADERLGLLTARLSTPPGPLRLVGILLDPARGGVEVLETPLEEGADGYPSMTPQVPQAHWFERAIYDFFGPVPHGHPRCKSLILHEAWPADWHPLRDLADGRAMPHADAPRRHYPFLSVKGEGVYEIPVGPIHAGIIEPGHFRFSCLGEVIQNLEIRLGYQHRGVEKRLTEVPWQHARFIAEAASSDTPVGNALAHAQALEQLLDVEPPPLGRDLRAMALEIERVASHLGDLGGICNDIGFAGGSAMFACMRGETLELGEKLAGSRFQTAYVTPGGVRQKLDPDLGEKMMAQSADLAKRFEEAIPLLLENPGALERMEGTGVIRPALARDFGLVGPAGRASGARCDARVAFRQEPYGSLALQEPILETGDVLARVRIRAMETRTSLSLIRVLLEQVGSTRGGEGHQASLPGALAPNAVGIGIVEAWRGELIHAVFTDARGHIHRYCVKDPSFNNWTGLAIAVRDELVSDFPLCNKSFGLSYSGNDL